MSSTTNMTSCLITCLSTFCKRNSSCTSIFKPFLELKELNSDQTDTILELLSNLLKDPQFTKSVAECFPGILLILMTLAIPIDQKNLWESEDIELFHRISCSVLGKLVVEHPDVLRFSLRYFEQFPAPFSSVRKNSTVKTDMMKKVQINSLEVFDYDIVHASYCLLKAKSDYFKSKWNWSEFYPFLIHLDEKVKWTAWMCIRIVLDMSESLLLKSVRSVTDPVVLDKFLIESGEQNGNLTIITSDDASQEVDLMLRKVPSIVSVAGVLLPVLNDNFEKLKCSLVPVPSMKENLRSLALAVATGKCVCVQGKVGCGKTSIIEYIANVTGRSQSDFIKIQLGDQTDSKIMLGTYRCTEIPGEFIWQPGILTRAVTFGKWLLLEDIDSATLDVVSTLSNLLETGTLSVPGHRDLIKAKSGFQLFVTQRLSSSTTGLRKAVSNASMLEKYWSCVNMDPFTREELVKIIETIFPKLKTIASKMVDVYLMFQPNEKDSFIYKSLASKSERLISTRDLMKWCSRAVVYYVYPSRDVEKQNLFEDAIDIFCCSVADEGKRQSLVVAIGHKLSINKVSAENIFQTYKPFIECEKDFIAGRVKLPCKKPVYADINEAKVTFAFTRPSACLLERIACCVIQKEPVLLVGETGTGKTSSVQHLAHSTGNTLIVINMNQLSESADLLGGYKPVDLKFLIKPVREEFEILFRSFFAVEPNKKFLEAVAFCYNQQKWDILLKSMILSTKSALNRLKDNSQAKKWEKLFLKLEKLLSQVKAGLSLGFAFIEGSLVRAIQNGYWVLLDEINLANAETLEYLSGLLEGSSGSLSLLERGDEESIKRHPNFTLFACMNPATDIGKKELPVGLRNRFTEFYVDELTSKGDLQILVNSYLQKLNLASKHEAIVKFYLSLHKEANLILFDGTMNKPHYSLRTLCRALSITAANPCEYELRSLYEAFCLSFLTQLDHKSYSIVENLIVKILLDEKTAKRILSTPIPKPKWKQVYINVEGYWISRGSVVPKIPENYILTQSVRRNLKDIARAVSIGKMPILLQGDTSVGKTSLITYLAKTSGHVCVRINNHEHTDLQEYVGSYVADERGKLIFREGILVEAMRKGYWIILDELNLAPSDVLEALNRVLDDNRELFISETQQVVKAHNEFRLFATQNPPGLYGGRKVLSRAFRNRFVELHFDEIPPVELQEILQRRCSMPESYCRQIINVMKDLQIRRKTTAAFAGKKGFITLRDLFRWGERYRLASSDGQGFYDWNQHLADEGYLVLAAKVRLPEEEAEIRNVIEKHLKRVVKPQDLFTLSQTTSPVTRHILEELLKEEIADFKHIVWTYHLRRMAVLLRKSCQFREPVLLVGETGCGKTTVCQLVATMQRQKLYAVNCHMHTESSDFLGNLRPVRDHENPKFFEWVDGPLIHAMRNGDLFLADEISLADDSVLERLNSLLEPERILVLTEKGIDLTNPDETNSILVANEAFLFIGTMNPGGDYGKKELSPALRNRFTEIWCYPCTERDDLKRIIEHNLHANFSRRKSNIASCMLNFVDWIATSELLKDFIISTRDILSWVHFINISIVGGQLTLEDAIFHGACLTYTDGLGSSTINRGSSNQLEEFKHKALELLMVQIKNCIGSTTAEGLQELRISNLNIHTELFGIEPFYIEKGPVYYENSFVFTAPTTKSNALKVLRAMQIEKPILLEGSPGVGKTSLVSAIAKDSGHSMFRINLSDQTDVCDLFGTDLPVEGGKGGEFSWRDGPFLRALRAGDWILLDELNLASQAVLESLNACFDHRGELFIPELSKTFLVKPGAKFFACQNPMRQGGARKGLPKSFLNRFTQVFVSALTEADLKFISCTQFPELSQDLVHRMVDFNSRLSREAGVLWGVNGSPWEMNLRDVTRWCEATIALARDQCDSTDMFYNPGSSVELIYVDRMRTKNDKETVREIYKEIFPPDRYPLSPSQPTIFITNDKLYFGDTVLSRSESSFHQDDTLLLRDQMPTLRSLAQCINMNWMSILVGESGSGKSSAVRVISQLMGQRLKTVVVNSEMDTNEILGGFEQTNYSRHLVELFEKVESLVLDCLRSKLNKESLNEVRECHSCLEGVRNMIFNDCESESSSMETQLFLQKVEELSHLVSFTKKLSLHTEELNQIIDELKSLSSIVEQESCLNAGGKFEWVDSLLVKCLQDGIWLLVDQVNLCSPALLDRLNGLLEPNGILTIGERGAGPDGNIMTVKPHKNFRLFLTMNPKYGEISRAMRNRGIEIYLLDRDKVSFEDLDVRSMLYNSGLVRKECQDVLVHIHDKVSQDLSTVGTLNVTPLLQSAFLISQQISRGFPLTSSFKASCEDVYVKARVISQQETKDRLISLIEDSLGQLSNVLAEEKALNLSSITWKIADIQENSKLATINQQGVLLSHCIDQIESLDDYSSNLESLITFLNLQHVEDLKDVATSDILPYLMLDFYEKSSQCDVELRNRWLEKQSVERMGLEVLSGLSEKLKEEVLRFDFQSPSEILPWDLPHLPKAASKEVKIKSHHDSNRLALLLYWNKINEDILKKESSKKESVRRYSTEVLNGTVTSFFKDQPLITDFTIFTNQVRKCTELMLREQSLTLNASDYVKLRRNLQWYKRYCVLGNLTFESKGINSQTFSNLDKISLLLKVHFKWLIKFIRNFTTSFSGLTVNGSCKMEMENLLKMVDSTNEQLFTLYDPVFKIGKKLKASMCLPLPHPIRFIANSFSRMLNLTHCLQSWKSDDMEKEVEVNLMNLSSVEGIDVRQQLLSLWNKFFTLTSLEEEVEQSLLKIEEYCGKNHLNLKDVRSVDDSVTILKSLDQTETTTFAANLQLWPLYEQMFLLLSCSVQQAVYEKEYNNDVVLNIATELWQKWSEILTIPVNVLAITNAILFCNQDLEKTARLIPVLTYLSTQFTQRPFAIINFKRFSHWEGLADTYAENVSRSNCDSQAPVNSISKPGLVNLVLELLLNKCQSKKESSILAMPLLGAHEARIAQLKKMNNLLWRNSVSFNSDKFDSLLNDRKMLITSTQQFLELSEGLNLEEELTSYVKDAKNPLTELKEILQEVQMTMEPQWNLLKRGKAWILFGYVRAFLFTSIGYIDPLYKVDLKLRYVEEDIKDFKLTTYSNILQSRLFGDVESMTNLHPRFAEIKGTLDTIFIEKDTLQSKKAYRPSNVEFLALVKDFESFRNTLGNYYIVQNQICELLKVHQQRNSNIKTAENAIRKVETWQESLEQFMDRIEHRFLASYPDLVLPALAAVSDIKRGICMMVGELQRSISISLTNSEDLTAEDFIEKLLSFPTISPSQPSLLHLVNVCTSYSTRDFISRNIKSEDTLNSSKEQFRVTLSGLYELYNHILLSGGLSKSLWQKLNDLMRQIILIWKQQQKEMWKREAEKESMYKNKGQIHCDELREEEEINLELENLFPTYREKDFNDMEFDSQNCLSLEENKTVVKEYGCTLLSNEDIQRVHQLFSKILTYTGSNWRKPSLQAENPDYIEPLLIRYNTVGLLLDNVTASLSPKLSQLLYSSLNYLTEVTRSISQGEKITKQGKVFDFYKDSNVTEVTSCLPLLRNISDRVNLLLNEWPDHPTLRSIHTVIQRILHFPITSSLSRFLTGLELLLLKMKEWEENAHEGVSLFNQMSALIQQIISWRRLELSSWKDCLNVTFQRLRSQSAKWCFWLYVLLESYISKSSSQDEAAYFNFEVKTEFLKEDQFSSRKLAEALHSFISNSPLVEFEARLELLLIFHCHAFFFEPSFEKDEVLSVTWNIYKYYNQFIDEVNARINNIRLPIEKKLKDFVKITRWNDISYWAVKETIAKSHKTLFKFMKEFEKGLKENVSPCLIMKPGINIVFNDKEDCNSGGRSLIDPDAFIMSLESIKTFDLSHAKHKIELKSHQLQRITRKLKRRILTSEYSNLRRELEEFIREYMERSGDLKKIEIDTTLPKPKQVSFAKSVLQQKKKALADYFKRIAHLGVSYRIGILAWKNRQDTVVDLMIPPLDLTAALRNFDSEVDKLMVQQWKGCENYYNKALAEFIALNQTLTKAHEDLGPLDVERFKGYSAHLMLMANEQKRILSEDVKYFVALRSQVVNLSRMKGNDVNLPKQGDLLESVKGLKQLLIILQSSLEQLQLYMNACPSKCGIDEHEVFELEPNVLPILKITKEDCLWEKVNSLIKDCSLSLLIISDQFNSVFSNVLHLLDNEWDHADCVPILTPSHFHYVRESYERLEVVKLTLVEIGNAFGTGQHPILRNIEFIKVQICEGTRGFVDLENKINQQIFDDDSMAEFGEVLRDILLLVLKAIQVKDKMEEKTLEEKTLEEKTSGKLPDQLKRNALSEMIIKSLKSNIAEMNLEDVSKKFNKLLLMIRHFGGGDRKYFKMIEECLPFFEQYLLYVHFYLNEQVAALRLTSKVLHLQLSVFLDLANNGFCIPKNLDLDVDTNGEENSQKTSSKGGMGLSNEEGDQDVSDRIESEDQLEDAKSANQEEKDLNDKECAEEEKGIDMSEDFEGKLQDIEKGENESENGDKDEDDGDLDKEMGETEEGADQQEKEIWGKDEEEDLDSDMKENGENGKGEELDEKTMGAKENDDGLQEDSRKSGEKEDISEMNETDINDDQIDPYHGNQQPEIEPEALDLPDDMNLDNQEAGDEEGQQDEDMFDIDNMKEPVSPSVDKTEEGIEENSNQEADKNEGEESSSDDDVEDSHSNQNIEAAPMESDTGVTEEDEAVTKERDEQDQPIVSDIDDTNRLTESALQVDVAREGTQEKMQNEVENKENVSDQKTSHDSQNDFGSKKSNQGVGNTEASSHEGAQTDQENSEINQGKKRKSLKQRENKTTTLMDDLEPCVKKTKMNIQERQDESEKLGENEKEVNNEADDKEVEYRHVDSKESSNRYAIDGATEDQVKEQAAKITMDVDPEESEEPMDVNMLDDDVNEESPPENPTQSSEKMSNSDDKSKGKSSKARNEQTNETGIMDVDQDLPLVDMTKVERGIESTFHTNLENLLQCSTPILEDFEQKRIEVKQTLSQWRLEPSTEDAIIAWNTVSSITDTSARELAEKLRLVLEPTHASRLKGDYRTGKRINMRKVIPYIASQFRKDKIWLRRTKPSKRNYQIILAIDDSSSMVDNESKEIAFESLSLISKAMMYLEAGQLGVISFGNDVNVLHPLGEIFTQESGARLMQKMRFEQTKTRVPQLVHYSIDMFNTQNVSTENAKLLVILSDGRGIFSEGMNRINHAVRRARLAGVFTVFVVIDNQKNKESVLDIRMPISKPGQPLVIQSYMEHFPFPFYIILRDINALPEILSDALRQWFELIGNMDS